MWSKISIGIVCLGLNTLLSATRFLGFDLEALAGLTDGLRVIDGLNGAVYFSSAKLSSYWVEASFEVMALAIRIWSLRSLRSNYVY